MNVIESIKTARLRGVPLIVVQTADPASTIAAVKDGYTTTPPPMVAWDSVRGATAENESGGEALRVMLDAAGMEQTSTVNPVEFLDRARVFLPAKTIFFVYGIHQITDAPAASQALWNLRDSFKTDKRTLVGLCPSIALPAELSQDVLVLDDPLPTDKDLIALAKRIYAVSELAEPDAETLEKIVDATLGLAAFPAEQSMAMSITRKGMDMNELWSRKQTLIEQTPGLSVWRGGESFDDIGGCENIKGFLRRVIAGHDAPRAIVFVDEIEKGIGTGQDTSGVSQNFLGTLLSWMEDNNASGMIFLGPPGAAKSAIAKATGAEAGIPTIQFNLGAMKGSLVGESERQIRTALKVIDSVSQKRSFFIATSNGIANLPPELRRRFTFGTVAFSLPSADERAAIWPIYQKKYGLDPKDPIPADDKWTGAEIKQCCVLSHRLKTPLRECAQYIVPLAVSAAASIATLAEQCDGRYISASYPGVYRKDGPPKAATNKPAERAISLGE